MSAWYMKWVPVAGWPALRMRIGTAVPSGLWVEYSGPSHDLLAAGVVTKSMLLPGKPGKKRIDECGESFRVRQRWGSGHGGEPVRLGFVIRYAPRERVNDMAGGPDALVRFDEHRRTWDQLLAVRSERDERWFTVPGEERSLH